ncbi:hypothetical protein ACFQT0_13730 [Hymenobacter humi]|uniref:Uncharacterized protein n=1 Tax=Hymenobacter humi TaxID=1411620 RepID=A0ABW2U7W7_9BACT
MGQLPPDFIAEDELVIAENEAGEWNEMLQQMIDFLERILSKSSVQASFLGRGIPIYTGFIDGDLIKIK